MPAIITATFRQFSATQEPISLDSEGHRRLRHPRRDFVIAAAAALAGGGVALAASGGAGAKKQSRVTTQPMTEADADVAVLGSLLDVELRQGAAYAVAAGALRGRSRAAARGLLSQERQHAQALVRAVGDLGASPAPLPSRAVLEAEVPSLHDDAHAFSYLADLERHAIVAYTDALVRLSTEDVRVTIAAILATEAEHRALLLAMLHHPHLSTIPVGPARTA